MPDEPKITEAERRRQAEALGAKPKTRVPFKPLVFDDDPPAKG